MARTTSDTKRTSTGRPPGRPSKFTPERRAEILEELREGAHYEDAAAFAGISYQTFQNWRLRGEKAALMRERELELAEVDVEYLEFFEAITRAQMEAARKARKGWIKFFDEDWKACRDFLARRYPERWGPTMALTSESAIDKMIKELEGQLARIDEDSENEEAWDG